MSKFTNAKSELTDHKGGKMFCVCKKILRSQNGPLRIVNKLRVVSVILCFTCFTTTLLSSPWISMCMSVYLSLSSLSNSLYVAVAAFSSSQAAQSQGGFADFSQAFGGQASNQPAPQAQPGKSINH